MHKRSTQVPTRLFPIWATLRLLRGVTATDHFFPRNSLLFTFLSPSPSIFPFQQFSCIISIITPTHHLVFPSVFIALFFFTLSGLLQYASSELSTNLPSFSLWLEAFEIQLISTAQLYLCFWNFYVLCTSFILTFT